MSNLPKRRSMGKFHTPPSWVGCDCSYFITIVCKTRGTNQLTRKSSADTIIDTSRLLMTKRRWHPELLLLMPDHVHAIASFSWQPGHGMNAVIRDWKRYISRHCGIEWQRDYFDHRIRSAEDHSSTWAYIINNPVRAGLVRQPEDWPYVWRPEGDRHPR